ncbi:AAA family ATPase [Galbibacter sp.]|uniref:AAA family ATPase n=1 Tax=Galbibacter sp. TaxID=2918471 RepID=UPI002C4934E4|nr:AAA family ATPase [Galbibacter sp.]HLV64122.1 AAA family ATPase [Galbibacter sp.]
MKLQTAQRQQVRLKIGLSGASGFGKTYSALLIAYGITQDWTKIAIIDTENKSASLYAHLGNYNVLELNVPYSPERYIEAIKYCENANMEVIIIDSISHEWQGKGGCLEIHEKLGGRFQDWAKITPRHTAFIDTILQSKCHIITTARRKIEYSLDTDQNGKVKVTKVGTKEETRSGFEYELTVSFELINDNHLAKASKDRTGLFMNKPEFVINQSTGKKLIQWCSLVSKVEDVEKEIKQTTTIEGLKHIYNKYPLFQSKIKDNILTRKKELESIEEQIIESTEITKATENGIN